MKLYNSMGPNPHAVRMFAAERGIELDLHQIDLMAGENRQPAFLEVNPAGQLPALVAADGFVVTEVTAICEYLDEHAGEPTDLIGTTPEARAATRMWTRRVDLGICEPMLNGFRFGEGLPIFKDRMMTLPEASTGLKNVAQNRLSWLNDMMADGRSFVTGEHLTLADVFLFCTLAFAGSEMVGQPLNPEHTYVVSWFKRMASRPSAAA